MRGLVKALFVIVVLPVVFFAVPAVAAEISGVVLGPDAIPLPGVRVTVTNTNTGASYEATTDDVGRYRVPGLAAGTYSVTAVLSGFHRGTRDEVVVDADGSSGVDLSIKPEIAETIVVTATRRETDVQSTAAAVTAVSGVELAELGKYQITDFISAVPGVTASGEGGESNRVIFRNVATSIDEPGRATTATYFDDFPISTSDMVPPIRLVDMDRVEVIKGPQGTLFGRSAMGGIVRYIPNKPSTEGFSAGFNTYLSSTTDGGTNSGLSAFANVPITDNFAFRVVGYKYEDGGFIDNVELDIPDHNDESTVGGRIALRWEATERFSLELNYLNQSFEGASTWVTTTWDPGDLDVAGDEGPDIPYDLGARTAMGGIESKKGRDHEFWNLKLEYELDSFTATFLATRTESETVWEVDEKEYVDFRAGALPYLTDPEIETQTDVLELRLVSSTDGFLDWMAGVYYEDEETHVAMVQPYYGPDQLLYGFIPMTDGVIAISQKSNETGSERAVYGELGLNFTQDTRLLFGYRNSHIKYGILWTEASGFFDVLQGFDQWVGIPFDTQDNVSTYKVSLEHSFNQDLFGYALASSGYRRGGFNMPTIVSKFSAYDPDTLWNYEVGLKMTSLDGLLRTNIAAYYLDWRDIQLVVQDPITFARETQNVGKAHIAGVELGVDYFVNENLRFFAGGSYSDPQLDEDVPPSIDPLTGGLVYTGRKGDRLPGSATETFSVGFNWEQPFGNGMKVLANGIYRYVGDRLNDFNLDLDVALPAYSLTDLRLGISHRSGWSAALFANNVFDEAVPYSIIRAGSAFEIVPTNRPRTVGLNFFYNF